MLCKWVGFLLEFWDSRLQKYAVYLMTLQLLPSKPEMYFSFLFSLNYVTCFDQWNTAKWCCKLGLKRLCILVMALRTLSSCHVSKSETVFWKTPKSSCWRRPKAGSKQPSWQQVAGAWLSPAKARWTIGIDPTQTADLQKYELRKASIFKPLSLGTVYCTSEAKWLTRVLNIVARLFRHPCVWSLSHPSLWLLKN